MSSVKSPWNRCHETHHPKIYKLSSCWSIITIYSPEPRKGHRGTSKIQGVLICYHSRWFGLFTTIPEEVPWSQNRCKQMPFNKQVETGLFTQTKQYRNCAIFFVFYSSTLLTHVVRCPSCFGLESNSEFPSASAQMVAAGGCHTVLLRNDGHAVAFGWNEYGKCNVPRLNQGITYTQVSAGGQHTVLLRSDGQAVAFGCGACGRCSIPPLDKGISYTQVSAGGCHTVLLRSDGEAVTCGSGLVIAAGTASVRNPCSIPPLTEELLYTQVSAGMNHTVLLRSDGKAVACSFLEDGQCKIPPLDQGISYTQVSAGGRHTVFLRSDGSAVACGSNEEGQCNVPRLNQGITYTQVSAGSWHTVLLRSDGQAVAFGCRAFGRCSIPPLDEGISYIQVSAGSSHTVLLRSDGRVVACGSKGDGQCSIPSLDANHQYVCDSLMLQRDHVVRLDFAYKDSAVILTCTRLDGHEIRHFKVQANDRSAKVWRRVAREMGVELRAMPQSVKMILPDGQLFASICRADPFAHLSDVVRIRPEKRMAPAVWRKRNGKKDVVASIQLSMLAAVIG